LVRSNAEHARTWHEALAHAGVKVPLAVVRSLIGMGGDKILPHLAGLRDDSRAGKAIARDRARRFDRRFAKVKPYPKARELIEALLARGIKVGVASSASRKDLRRTLDLVGVSELLSFQICADDAPESKPDPGIVTRAVKKAGVPKRRILFVGDTPYDVEAAALAGICCAAVLCGGVGAPVPLGGSYRALLSGAIAHYADPAAMLAELLT
jgi:HAD superfamily hydrolase (TIGR01509 family)